MPQMILVILDDMNVLPKLLSSWREIGVPGATILESVGAYRAEGWLERAGLAGLAHLFEADEVRRRTVMAAVSDELVGLAIAEAERVVGGFDRPNSGILIALPVTQLLGLQKREPTREPALPAGSGLVSSTTSIASVADAAGVLAAEPAIVHLDTPLADVVQALAARPGTDVAAVVGEDDRLVGLLDRKTLSDGLLVQVFPEEFMAGISELDDVLQFAQSTRMRTARDAMQPPLFVRPEQTAKDAFRLLHQHQLEGLPVVDEQHRVIGYLSMMELLALLVTPASGSGEESR